MYDHKKIEEKWRKKWRKTGIYKVDLDKDKNPYYNLMMFPYPSAEGLHVGNMYAFVHSDCWGRYMKLKGYNVFEPIGLDGFGIHSENFAMKIGQHIKDVSKRTEKKFYQQLQMIGNQYDWSRTVETYKPDYYKWTQWLFLQMYKKGLAYRKKSPVNWCPSCKTVLSDEQVILEKCERCDTLIEKKQMKQWFFKITDYAQRLLDNLEQTDPKKKMNWSPDVKTGQINWIGRSEGVNITYKVQGSKETVTCFTSYPETNFGATFIVVAPEYEKLFEITKKENLDKVKKYVKKVKKMSEQDRIAQGGKKTGVFTGSYCVNNLTGYKMPVYAADFVLGGVGTGAVVGVPGHDLRDFEFAQEFDLKIIRVMKTYDGDDSKIDTKEKVNHEGIMINSDFLNGLDQKKARKKIMDYLEEKGWGEKTVTYKLRDWCVSRQRYWGPPIPMVYCKKCGWVPVDEKDLPVELPELDDFHPDGSGKGPLNKVDDFVNTTCPSCGGRAKRETDVSDPFVDSSWYFFRYLNAKDDKKALHRQRIEKWMPVDMYIGGKEHTVLHLLYSRFVTMVFYDLGYCDFEEPYAKFFGHGLLIKDGAKMSKSKGNVINPDEYVQRFGADSVRLYLMFLGQVSQGGDWRDSGMAGMFRFVKKLYKIFDHFGKSKAKPKTIKDDLTSKNISTAHKTVKKVTQDLERMSFNTAIASIMEMVNWYKKENSKLNDEQNFYSLKVLALLISPFAPHLSEEFWEILGFKDSIFHQTWPDYKKELVKEEQVEFVVQVNGKLRGRLKLSTGAKEEEVFQKALENKKIAKYIKGKEIKKKIFIKDKLINLVI